MTAEPDSASLGPLGQAVSAALALADTRGRIHDANAAFRRLLGDGEHVLGKGTSAADTERLHAFLVSCSGSRSPLVGAFEVGGDALRFEGSLFRARRDDRAALVLLQAAPREETTVGFRLLNEKIGELSREVLQRRRAEALLDAQRSTLEMIVTGASLEATLGALCEAAEAQSEGRMRTSILLLDDTGHLRHGAALNLPASYVDAIDGVAIGEAVGSCGTAAFRNEMVVSEDIASDPLWADFRDVALAHGLASCWSTPINARDGTVLGTFAMYYDRPATPSEAELRTIAIVTRTAAIAVQRHRTDTQITDLLARERTLRGRAEAANRAKDEFLALVSHELRNPLNAMLGWVRVLQTAGVDAAMTERGLDTIERNVDLQAQLIDDLLDFSRVSTGQLELDRAPADLAEIVERAVESFRVAALERGLTLSHTADASLPRVPVDAERIHQVLSNLIGNALKFTPSGGRVTVRLECDGETARIEVEDTGEGIDPEFLPFVFERFHQFDSSRTRRHGGLGLGLAIVAHIVERHGGRVDAHSDGPGRGARFTVRLPLHAATSARAPEPERDDSRRIDGLHVLVVDDEPDALSVLEAALGLHGARVTIAHSADAALDSVMDDPPDCVVSDIAMPGTDGYAFLTRFRLVDGTGRCPCVALTAYASDSDRDAALAAGFDAHVAKPVEPAALVALIASLTENDAQAGERT